MRGRMMGLKLALEEIVVEREPPRRKARQTLDARALVHRAHGGRRAAPFREAARRVHRGCLASLVGRRCLPFRRGWPMHQPVHGDQR